MSTIQIWARKDEKFVANSLEPSVLNQISSGNDFTILYPFNVSTISYLTEKNGNDIWRKEKPDEGVISV